MADPPEKPSPAQAWVEAIDLESPATTAVSAWVRIAALIGSLVVFFVVLRNATAPMMVRQTLAPLNGDTYEGHRFGLRLDTRKAIFAELAAVEVAERKRALQVNSWQGHLWSREDDRGHHEMTTALRLAKQYKISLTHVYMVLDEGIREKWPGPDGEPLIPTTPPQDPRSTW